MKSEYAMCEEKVYDGQPMNPALYFDGIVGKTVLDIGCGSGNLGAALEGQGNACYGITISSSEAELAKGKLTRVIVGDIEAMETLPFPEDFFDVIILADILEHLRNPMHVLCLREAPTLEDIKSPLEVWPEAIQDHDADGAGHGNLAMSVAE